MGTEMQRKVLDEQATLLSEGQCGMLIAVARGFVWESIHRIKMRLVEDDIKKKAGKDIGSCLTDYEILGLSKEKTMLERLVKGCDVSSSP